MKRLQIALCVFLLLTLCSAVCAEEGQLPGNFQKAYICGAVTCGGKTLPGVQVHAMGPDGMAVAIDAENGNYALGVAAGQWTLFASKDGYYLPKPVKATVGADEAKNDVNIEMVKSTAFIEGTVVDEENKPIGGATVTALPSFLDKMMGEGSKGEEEAPMMPVMSGFRGALCDKDGNFRIQVIKGAYQLTAHFTGYEMSPKNPMPKLPGMEDMPEEARAMMAKMMPALGVQVTVAEGETKKGVITILRPAQEKKVETTRHEIPEKPETSVPQVNVVIGKAQLTPNNVLHWTRAKKSEEPAFYIVLRSTVDFSGKEKGDVVKFQFPAHPYGVPQGKYYSFTDNSAVPGKTYWYVVYELSASGAGPYSNSVKVTTK